MFGFRSDGKKIKDATLLFKLIPHIMRTRNDAEVYFSQEVPIKEMDEYIDSKAQEGIKLSYMHIIYAAAVRTIARKTIFKSIYYGWKSVSKKWNISFTSN